MQLKVIVIVLTIVSLFDNIEQISAETFDECNDAEIGDWVASASDCSQYIYCDEDDSIIYECDDDEYFSELEGMCDAKENVYCPLDEAAADSDEEDDPNETAQTFEATTSPAIISSTTAMTFDTLTGSPIVRDECPQSDDPNQLVLLAHSESCSEYYVCYHGHAIEMHCTNYLHFNTETGKCDFPENVQCLQNRPNANKCLPHITDFFPHTENCNYFYYCIKGFLTVQRCPFYYGWDVEKRTCVKLSQAKCHNKLQNLNFR